MNREWTSRERVQASLEHTEPDRVPIGLSVSYAAYQKLRQYLGFLPKRNEQRSGGEEVLLDPEIAGFLGIDLAYIRLHPAQMSGSISSGALYYDAWHIGRQVVECEPGAFSLETIVSPLADARLEDLRDFPWPDPQDPAWVDGLEEEARELYTGTGLALVGRFGGSILETAHDLRGAAQWNSDLAENPDFACALLNRIAALQIALDEAGLRAAGKYLSIFDIRETGIASSEEEDLLFSDATWHDIWRQTICPVLERRWQAARLAFVRYEARAKLMLSVPAASSVSGGDHGACGRLAVPAAFPSPAIFQDMIDGGVEVYGALSHGSNFRSLKDNFGDRLSFYGGLDAGILLTHENENDVRQDVRECLEQLGTGGGFVLAPSQVVQGNALPQNIVAMCDTVKVYGRYSSG